MTTLHPELAEGKWKTLTFLEQMGNVSSEIGRAVKWKKKGNLAFFEKAFRRAIELLDLTIQDPKNSVKRKELLRAREMLADCFLFENRHRSSHEAWLKYFHPFAIAARRQAGR